MNFHKDIRGYIWFHIYGKAKSINRFFSEVLFRFLCFAKNVKVGKNIYLLGIPSIIRHPLSRISIGDNCNFKSSYNSTGIGTYRKTRIVTVEKNAEIKIGNKVGISGTTLLAESSICIEDNVLIGVHSIVMDTDRHSTNRKERLSGKEKPSTKPVLIKSGAWIGMNSTILKGVTIGSNSIIGANSLVVTDIPDNAIAVGNPCKVIRLLKPQDN